MTGQRKKRLKREIEGFVMSYVEGWPLISSLTPYLVPTSKAVPLPTPVLMTVLTRTGPICMKATR